MKPYKIKAHSIQSVNALDSVLRHGQSIALLKHLHILTADGKLNQDTRRKLKQVNHLLQFIEPLITELRQSNIAPNVVDHGAGKSYLGFLLYDALFKEQSINQGSVWGIESRDELVQSSISLAKQLGFESMEFILDDTANALNNQYLPNTVHIVTALHACNTATDDAIAFGLTRQVPYMVLVPCCQAEIAGLLHKNRLKAYPNPLWSVLWHKPLHMREFGSHLTNVLRCLQLEAAGYHVTVTELVGWEHSLKNELILAKKIMNTHQKNVQLHIELAKQRLNDLLSQTHLSILAPRFLPK